MSATEKLKGAFAQGLGLDGTTDYDRLAYGSTTGWDSVAHMAVIAAVPSKSIGSIEAFAQRLPINGIVNLLNTSTSNGIATPGVVEGCRYCCL